MTSTETADVAEYVEALWPQSAWTQQQWDLFRRDLRDIRIEPEQARAVIEEYRRNPARGVKTPNYGQLIKRLRAVEHLQNRRHNRSLQETIFQTMLAGLELMTADRRREVMGSMMYPWGLANDVGDANWVDMERTWCWKWSGKIASEQGGAGWMDPATIWDQLPTVTNGD